MLLHQVQGGMGVHNRWERTVPDMERPASHLRICMEVRFRNLILMTTVKECEIINFTANEKWISNAGKKP